MLFVLTLTSSVYAADVEVELDTEKFDEDSTDCVLMPTGKWMCLWDPLNNSSVGEQVTVPSGDPPSQPVVVPLECPDRFELDETGDNCVPVKRTVVIDDPIQRKILEQLEQALERFEDNPPRKSSEREEYELLKELASCSRGVGSATGIQQTGRFIVSTTWVNPAIEYLTSLDYTGNHLKLKTAIEECKAQKTVLESVVLGRQYVDRVNAEIDNPTYYHADRQEVKALGAFPAINLNEHSYIKSVEKAEQTLCNNYLYGADTKRDYNCEKDGSVVTAGQVEYTSSAYHKWVMWKTMDHGINTSVVAKTQGSSPVDQFITAQGGYEKAREAIDWQEHFDLQGQALNDAHE